MPLGPYKDFKECVLKNRDKANPEAYCGALEARLNSRRPAFKQETRAPRDFSTDLRKEYAKKGIALPDGSYPIPDKGALRRAIAAFGRSTNPGQVKAHIIKRARALGATDLLPEGWIA